MLLMSHYGDFWVDGWTIIQVFINLIDPWVMVKSLSTGNWGDEEYITEIRVLIAKMQAV